MTNLTPDEKIKAWVAGSVLLLVAGLFLLGIFSPKKSATESQQDSLCRSLGRDGANAKTQAQYDYAKQKFDESCTGWTDSR